MEIYTTWKIDNVEVRNYGGNGYNVYIDGTEIDYFTYYGNNLKDINEVVKEHIEEILFDNLF